MPMTPEEKKALLKQSSALLKAHPVRGVKPADLARVLTASKLQRMSTGEVLCTEGEPGSSMFFLLDGAIKVTRTDPHGRKRELAVVQSPAIVGHMALIDNSPRSATCAAEGRTIVASLERRTWNRILHEPSERGAALRRVLCASLTRQLVGANASIRKLVNGADAQPDRPATRSKDRGHEAAPNAARSQKAAPQSRDVEESDLLRVAGVLEGWQLDDSSLRDADELEHVFTEDQLRNRKNIFR